MSLLMAINLILFAFSAIALWYMIRYRIHIHATYQARDKPIKRARQTVARQTPDTDEIVKTLIALGAKRKIAEAAALRALEDSSSQEFNDVLRLAIQECRK